MLFIVHYQVFFNILRNSNRFEKKQTVFIAEVSAH
jgi:hypothetical protein